ncbi:hypothetical protein QBC43DRAFT_331765 [Cladorrhinum sp. PSN259]|nr:hypothetical protein QBC43DRAFT_331765 [Cladorrhinum sp. PSN259]
MSSPKIEGGFEGGSGKNSSNPIRLSSVASPQSLCSFKPCRRLCYLVSQSPFRTTHIPGEYLVIGRYKCIGALRYVYGTYILSLWLDTIIEVSKPTLQHSKKWHATSPVKTVPTRAGVDLEPIDENGISDTDGESPASTAKLPFRSLIFSGGKDADVPRRWLYDVDPTRCKLRGETQSVRSLRRPQITPNNQTATPRRQQCATSPQREAHLNRFKWRLINERQEVWPYTAETVKATRGIRLPYKTMWLLNEEKPLANVLICGHLLAAMA